MKFSSFLPLFCLIGHCFSLPVSLHAQKTPEGILWTFDEPSGSVVHDSAGNIDDHVEGYSRRVPGVQGKALEFDGYSTGIIRRAQTVPHLGQAFTLSAYVALNNYPWNWVPIADQSADRQVGFFFGIDALGHVGFDAAVNGVWQQLTTNQRLPLKKWVSLTASFDTRVGMTIYINGEAVANLPTTDNFAQADQSDLYIGRVRDPTLPYPSWLIHPQDPVKYSFDGYLDEVKILNRSLSAAECKAAYAQTPVPDQDVIPYAVLPSGPAGAGPFGALYASLQFTPAWDRPRRIGPDSDVVVRFEHSPIRLVFWQGTNYIPAWITGNGKWYSDEFLETWGPRCPDANDCEPMSDKQSRYSHVSILESSPARAVIHWRYALAEARNYKGAFQDPETGWFDWADEYWYVYPDATAVRKQILWSSVLNPEPPTDHEWQETIVINGPGQRPEDNINPDALTLMNMNGETKTYTWGAKADGLLDYPNAPENTNLPAGANIQIVNLKSGEKPFQIVPPVGAHIKSFNDEKSYFMFQTWNHWPVAQISSSGRPAVAPDRPSHTSLSHIYWEPYQKGDDTETKLLLDGLTTTSPEQLLLLAKSWIAPPAISAKNGDVTGAEYDPSQRAFLVHRPAAAPARTITLDISANSGSPLVNPAFVIENWSDAARITVTGKGVKVSCPAHTGYVHHLEGDSLIVFLEYSSTQETQVQIEPVAEQGR
jgi:hypothetical protein